MKTSEELVMSFLSICQKENINYAIARNYENYPYFDHDLDIFCSPKDYQDLKNILLGLISIEWDYYKEELSYTGSSFEDQNVNCLKIFNSSNNSFLQVDFFYGLTFFGLNHINIESILEMKIFDAEKKFYRVNKELEMYYRTFQIASRYSAEGKTEKLTSYAQSWMSFFSDKTKFNFKFSIISDEDFNSLNMFLQNNNFDKYLRLVRFIKLCFVLKRFIQFPISSFLRFSQRCKGILREYFTKPSGINLYYDGDINESVKEQLNFFTKIKVIPGWGQKELLSLTQRIKLRERGGVILVNKSNTTNLQDISEQDFKHFLLARIYN